MPISVGTNGISLSIQRNLDKSSAAVQQSSTRLASGLRINSPSDDAASLAVATNLQVSQRVYTQGIRNINDGISALSIAEGAAHELSTIVTRISELADQAANGTYSSTQRQALDNEAQQLRSEYYRITETTQFNDVGLIDGSQSNLGIQAGFTDSGNGIINLSLDSFNTFTSNQVVGDGTFTTSYTSGGLQSSGRSVAIGDFNNDGKNDFVDLQETATGTPFIYIGNGDGTFKTPVSYATGFTSYYLNVEAGDVNSDGYADIVFSSVGAQDNISVMIANSNGTFKLAVSYQAGDENASITLIDMDRDGDRDIVTIDRAAARVSVFMNNGNGTFVNRASYVLPGTNTNFQYADIADINGDTYKDVVVANSAANTVSVFLANSNGTLNAAVNYTATEANRMVLGDFNGDGIYDVATSMITAGNLNILIGNSNGTFKASISYGAPGLTEHITTTDMNGDGYLDLVGTSSANRVLIFSGNGNGTFRAPISFATGNTPRYLRAGNINGDATPDIIVAAEGSPGGAFIYTANTQISSVTTAVLGSFSLSTQSGARAALDSMTTALDAINANVGRIGAQLSRLSIASNVLAQTRENYYAATSRLLDTDVASESASLVAAAIRQQTASALLAQANQVPALALRLLKG